MLRSAIFSHWGFVRILRLGIGLYLAFSGISDHEYAFAFLGGVFVIQAVWNLGCCGPMGCSVDRKIDDDVNLANDQQLQSLRSRGVTTNKVTY